MTLNNRKTYVLIVFTLFIVFFILWGIQSIIVYSDFKDFLSGETSGITYWVMRSRTIYVLSMALMGAWGFSGLVGGFFLTFNFIGRKNNTFKVIMCIFFFVPIWISMFLGITIAVPYAIYNFVLLKHSKVQEKERHY